MTKTITKADIVDYLNKELGLNKSECKMLVEDFLDEIKNCVRKTIENTEIINDTFLIIKLTFKVFKVYSLHIF